MENNMASWAADRAVGAVGAKGGFVTTGIISNGKGRIEITYAGDGSETQDYYDEKGNLISSAYRSADFAEHLANGGTLADYHGSSSRNYDRTQTFSSVEIAQNRGGGPVYNGKALFGTNFIGPGPEADPYKLPDINRPGKFLQPLDAVDAAAQRHDYAYWKAGASGVKSALFDKRVVAADLALAKEAYSIMVGYERGRIDNVTGLPISFRTYMEAYVVYKAFLPLTINKFLMQ